VSTFTTAHNQARPAGHALRQSLGENCSMKVKKNHFSIISLILWTLIVEKHSLFNFKTRRVRDTHFDFVSSRSFEVILC
jgi:hypothetical protein